jgi:hypothetical protein
MTVETVYNDLPRHLKDGAGLPAYYYDLSVEQRFFVEDFYAAVTLPEALEEAVEVKEIVEELLVATEALIQRYTGNNNE